MQSRVLSLRNLHVLVIHYNFFLFFQVHDLQVQLTNNQAQLADELKNKDHIMGGVQTLQQQLSEANREHQEEMEKMRNANMVY